MLHKNTWDEFQKSFWMACVCEVSFPETGIKLSFGPWKREEEYISEGKNEGRQGTDKYFWGRMTDRAFGSERVTDRRDRGREREGFSTKEKEREKLESRIAGWKDRRVRGQACWGDLIPHPYSHTLLISSHVHTQTHTELISYVPSIYVPALKRCTKAPGHLPHCHSTHNTHTHTHTHTHTYTYTHTNTT